MERQAQRVFEDTKAGLYPPAQMIEGFHVLKREGTRQRRGSGFKLAVVQLEAANAELHRIVVTEIPAPRAGRKNPALAFPALVIIRSFC